MSGWGTVLTALGSWMGYLIFWGSNGYQGLLWIAGALAAKALLEKRYPGFLLLHTAVAALIISAGGVIFQAQMADTTPVGI